MRSTHPVILEPGSDSTLIEMIHSPLNFRSNSSHRLSFDTVKKSHTTIRPTGIKSNSWHREWPLRTMTLGAKFSFRSLFHFATLLKSEIFLDSAEGTALYQFLGKWLPQGFKVGADFQRSIHSDVHIQWSELPLLQDNEWWCPEFIIEKLEEFSPRNRFIWIKCTVQFDRCCQIVQLCRFACFQLFLFCTEKLEHWRNRNFSQNNCNTFVIDGPVDFNPEVEIVNQWDKFTQMIFRNFVLQMVNEEKSTDYWTFFSEISIIKSNFTVIKLISKGWFRWERGHYGNLVGKIWFHRHFSLKNAVCFVYCESRLISICVCR